MECAKTTLNGGLYFMILISSSQLIFLYEDLTVLKYVITILSMSKDKNENNDSEI